MKTYDEWRDEYEEYEAEALIESEWLANAERFAAWSREDLDALDPEDDDPPMTLAEARKYHADVARFQAMSHEDRQKMIRQHEARLAHHTTAEVLPELLAGGWCDDILEMNDMPTVKGHPPIRPQDGNISKLDVGE